ncbi:T9SS type A sorting domain-containing protein [Parabacteroides faecis]|uniref:T9SS type A sorting domain-containing protein n=1 Tax=Parabacteroides faecis TaxID=1217282 RepID=A0ABR6KLK1_9BACT|nr:T9SS type A sorting domain-containing protein [Parabacteroides faecis]MBB4622380.1 hypothetical protein [Parabacteroides faecis]GGK10957.1 hypothetical protein GCM10007084_37740 [Parabacteroides faecis]
MKTIYSKLFLSLLLTFLFSTISVAQYKIQGPGISPSKDTVYAGIKYEYKVVNFPNTRSLVWQTLWGLLDGREGESVKITWDNVPQGTIMVTGFNGTSNVTMEAKVKISGIKPVPEPEPEKPSAPEFISKLGPLLFFSNVENTRTYQWTLPRGCKTTDGLSGTFQRKDISNNNVWLLIETPLQLYYEGDIKVQAISNKNSLLSETTKYKLKVLDISYLNIIEVPEAIYSDDKQKTYTIAVDNIAGAKYKWNISNGIIVSGQNTNRITVRPDSPYPYYKIDLDFSINETTSSKSINIKAISNEYGLFGPEDVYDKPVEFYVKYPQSSPIYQIAWLINQHFYSLNPSSKFVLDPSNLNIGENILTVHVQLSDRYIKEYNKIIIKHSNNENKIYSITYDNNTKVLKVSQDQTCNLDSKLSIRNKSTIQIYNQQGVLVLSKAHLNTNSFESNLNNLKQGIYFVIVTDGKNKTEQKIVIR